MAGRRRLLLGEGLSLPIEAITEALGIVGVRGSGKSYTSGIFVEEVLRLAQQTVIVDPLDVWWGLRSSANGKKAGIPVTVLGGEHGDLPLDEGDAKPIADLAMAGGASMVLSIKHLSKAAQRRFVGAFCRRLYRYNKDPLHVVLDEADIFAPQNPRKGDEGANLCLSAVDDVVRRGRASGLGCTLVSQRPAVIHKDVFTQIAVLIVMRLISPQDRAAVRAWIKDQADEEHERAFMARLPRMKTGRGMLWAPEMLGDPIEGKFRTKRTFDSTRTPKIGERRVAPKRVAKVDLDAFREKLAETVEKAKAKDPRHLQKRIRELERQLAAKPAKAPKVERVEVSVLEKDDRAAIVRAVQMTEKTLEDFEARAVVMRTLVTALKAIAEKVDRAQPSARFKRRAPDPPAVRQTPGPRPAAPDSDLPRRQQQILDTLAWLGSVGITSAHRTQLAILAGVSPTSGSYANNLGRLRSAGLLDYGIGRTVLLTEEGDAAATHPHRPVTSEDVHTLLQQRLRGKKWGIVKALIDVFPESLGRDELAEQTGQSPTSGSYANYLGALRSMGLIDYGPGRTVVARDVLFVGAA